MYPLDDDNLDRLSREAAEHFEVEAGASGWDHLEQRLNKEMPQEKKRRRFLFWLFLITATTGGALTGILTYHPITPLAKNVTSTVNETRTPNTTPNNAVSGNKETTVTTAAPKTDKLPASNTGKPENDQPAAPAATATVPTKPLTEAIEKKPTPASTKPARERIQKAPATLNYAAIAPGSNNNRPLKPAKQRSGRRRTGTTSKQHNHRVPTVTEDNITTYEPENRNTTANQATAGQPVDANKEVAIAPVTQTDSAQPKPVATPVVDSTKTTVKQQQKKNDKIQQPLEFGVMAGPDMSAVAFGPLYKAGYNFGLQVAYRFSNRWSVNTGVIYTKKFYKTDSSHFEYKDNTWPNNKILSRVEGNCSMWEIPVNVRYDFSFNNKRRWFASTGLSTYLMDEEDYEAYYRWNGGNAYPQPLYNDTNSTYLFSIWNLSVGMERSLGKRFSLQAEPYLKVPLQDLGKGNMRMNSYGILFTLKYKPFLNSKK